VPSVRCRLGDQRNVAPTSCGERGIAAHISANPFVPVLVDSNLTIIAGHGRLLATLVTAAIDGTLPRGVGVARLRDAPAEWSKQHAMLGLVS
jgi:hypothetical protein